MVVARMEKDSCKSWDDAKKSALVAQIVSGKLSVKSACERHHLSSETIQDWVRVFRRTTLQAFDEHLRQTFLLQGADAAALGSAEYTGTLADIPIGDLIQTFQMGGKGGVITITRDGEHSQIWCDKGELIDAESGPLRGEAAVYRILSLERGQVLADFHSEPRERTIELPANVLLLEAARRKDESKRLLERLGNYCSIYRHGEGQPAPAERAEGEVFALCDGRLSLREVLEQSSQGDLETLSALARLVERRQLVRYGASLAPRSPPPLVITIGKDTPHTGVSFLPVVASHRPEVARRKLSPLAFVAAGMALGTGIWMAASILPPGTLTSEREPGASAATPEASARSFQVDSSVEPRHAELWLDGVQVGVGQLRRELQRDGIPHSLRIVATGYAPTTLLFVDAAPPAHIELEMLSPPAAAHDVAPGRVPAGMLPAALLPAGNLPTGNAAPSGAASREPVSGSLSAGADGPGNAPASEGALPAATSARAAWHRPNPAARPRRPAAATGKASASSEATPETKANVPRIQIIDDDKPVVQVIE
jgi:Domain of unknown function (DUF4388)/Transposase